MSHELIALMPSAEWTCAAGSRSSRVYSSHRLLGRLVGESNRSPDPLLENSAYLHMPERAE